jgi:hypothetical protein
MQAEVERVPTEDVAHVLAGDDDQFESHFLSHAFEPGRAHFP